jgi:hypothetical protein
MKKKDKNVKKKSKLQKLLTNNLDKQLPYKKQKIDSPKPKQITIKML